jgi:catechol 2,3-dioxygenase-like lactoylglutathione lyase family enzyme
VDLNPGGVRELRLVVTAEDNDEALAFYRDVLGLRQTAVFSSPGGGRSTRGWRGRRGCS